MVTSDPQLTPSSNAAVSTSLADRLEDLGGIDASRVRSSPAPGTASVADLVRVQAQDGRLYELVDNTLVEKAMGWQESLLAMVLVQWLRNYLDHNNLGLFAELDRKPPKRPSSD